MIKLFEILKKIILILNSYTYILKLKAYWKLSFIISEDIMNEEAPTLKWGDIVRIHGVNLSK